jgi:hypothetical protein
LLIITNTRKEKIIAMYDARERVYKNGKKIKAIRMNRLIFVLWGTFFRKSPSAMQAIKSKYPPKVLGSPVSPSKGALTLMPWGICRIP